MLHMFLIVCGIVSVPFICIYLFYTTFIAILPDYKKLPAPLGTRIQSVLRPREFYFVFLLPCLNEEKVIQNTLKSILGLPYKNLIAVVIDDASDDDTAEAVKTLRDPRVRLFQRTLPNARQGKGEALNDCYSKVLRAVSLFGIDPQTVIIGVIDGDGRPSDDILLEAVEAFVDPQVGAAQSRIRITNRQRILPLMQDLEFGTTVAAIQNSREYLGSVGLGGNGQFTRLSALMSLGDKPWTRCLLEDFDLGLRILLKDWQIRFLSNSYVAQQGLISFKRFIRQRARWVQGNMQCLVYTKQILQSNLPWTAKIDMLYFLLQPWLNMLGTVLQIAAWVAFVEFLRSNVNNTLFGNGSIVMVVLRTLLWLAFVFGPGILWVSMHYKSSLSNEPRKYLTASIFFPVYNLIVIPSVWLAFWKQLVRKRDWVKTERLVEQR